jgi:NADH pyrophosphatase NudC (nudix superfamily)
MTDAAVSRQPPMSTSTFRFCPRCGAPLTEPATAETRAICSNGCGFVHYDNPVPVVAAIVEHEGKVLLARNKAWPETWYALIAGFLERQEDPVAAVAREVREELGLDAGPPTLVGVYPFEMRNQVLVVYHVQTSGPITLGDELVDVKLVEPAACGAWRRDTGLALRDWLRARGHEPVMTDLPG